jgi:hypothetical protein
MKFQLHFKTPDVLVDVKQDVDDQFENNVPSAEADYQAFLNVTKKFLRYEESITVEFDTEAGTATVIPK